MLAPPLVSDACTQMNKTTNKRMTQQIRGGGQIKTDVGVWGATLQHNALGFHQQMLALVWR